MCRRFFQFVPNTIRALQRIRCISDEEGIQTHDVATDHHCVCIDKLRRLWSGSVFYRMGSISSQLELQFDSKQPHP